MSTRETIYKSVQYVLQLFLLPLSILILVSSCGDDPTTPADQIENAKGTVQGVVIDKATGDALSGVGVTLVYEDSTDDGSQTFSGSTGDDGSFTLSDVPVSTDAKTNDGGKSNPYTLRLDASSLDNYRDSYLAEVDVVFESTEGGDGGIATDMVSNVKIPLSEQAVTVSGKAHTNSDKVISGATVELYQQFNPVINGDNSTETEMLVATGETGDDGSFTFEGVEEDAQVKFRFIDDSDPANVIDHETGYQTTPAGEESASMDLGVVYASEDDQSGAFYVTDVAPSPEANIGEDQTFMYVFNRPVAENAYTDASASFGVGSMKDDMEFQYEGEKSFKSPGDIEFDVSWGDTRDTLFVEPEVSTMKDGSEYQLEVDAFDDDRFVDEHDNMITWGASEHDAFDVENLNFFTNFNASVPHTVELAVDSTGNHPDTDWNTGQHSIEWTMTNDPAEVKEYEIFISRDDGAYQHVQTVSAEDANHGELDYDFYAYSNPNLTDGQNDTPDWVNTFSTNARILITNEDDLPVDEAHSHKVKVRAVSKNLVEGEFSNEITVEDVVSPGIEAYTETDDADIYVSVEEPLDKGTAENADNFTVTDDTNGELSISSVSYDRGNQDNPNGQTGFDIVITVDDASNLTTGDIEISSDVTDLAGNEFDTNDNTTNY